MINMGMNQGMFPIAGYNYGARNYDRLLRVLKCTMTGAVLITTVGWIIAQSMPYECARLFTSDQTLISISKRAITLTMITFPLVGAQMASTGFFQSIGKAKISMLLSLSRQLLFFLPAQLLPDRRRVARAAYQRRHLVRCGNSAAHEVHKEVQDGAARRVYHLT